MSGALDFGHDHAYGTLNIVQLIIIIIIIIINHISINLLAVESFFYPPIGTEIMFYIRSPGTKFLPCVLFGTDFFLWNSRFPG